MTIPVIGSLNGVTRQSWLTMATEIAQAGADALELNIYEVVADPEESGVAIEHRIRDVVAGSESHAQHSGGRQTVARTSRPSVTSRASWMRRAPTGSCSSIASISLTSISRR